MNKVIEDMYFGLPIVAFDLHETRVSADGAAVYAQANSEEGLADGIAALLDDPDRRARMADIGRRRVVEKLAWDHSVAPLLAAYDRACAPRRASMPDAASLPHEQRSSYTGSR